MEWLNEKKDPLHPIVSTHAERDGVDVEVAMQYTDTYTDQIFAYANNINTIEGGMHLLGSHGGDQHRQRYARKRGILKEADVALLRRYLRGIDRGRLRQAQDPQFEGQTKTKLGNNKVRGIVNSLVSERLEFFFEENPK